MVAPFRIKLTPAAGSNTVEKNGFSPLLKNYVVSVSMSLATELISDVEMKAFNLN